MNDGGTGANAGSGAGARLARSENCDEGESSGPGKNFRPASFDRSSANKKKIASPKERPYCARFDRVFTIIILGSTNLNNFHSRFYATNETFVTQNTRKRERERDFKSDSPYNFVQVTAILNAKQQQL